MSPLSRPAALTTIGYEGASLPAFLATLKAAGVTLLLDVRELPISRRKGFSKTPLSHALKAAGIDYRHERALGAPRNVRHRLREDGDFKRYFADFREYLATQDALLDQLARSLSGCVALLCFERNPAECHRSVVVAALAKRTKTGFLHLSVSPEDAQQKPAHPRAHPRQGLPAT
jgi:uncharacterized protein (DUF488 family)